MIREARLDPRPISTGPMPLPMTRRMAHHFLRAPDDFDIPAAIVCVIPTPSCTPWYDLLDRHRSSHERRAN
jgi:hypothetical protein